MLDQSAPADPAIHEAAIRAAYRCRYVIQAILRDEERADAEREFYLIVREEFERLVSAGKSRNAAKAGPARGA